MFDVVDDGDGQAVLAEYGLSPDAFSASYRGCVSRRTIRSGTTHPGPRMFAGRPTTRAIEIRPGRSAADRDRLGASHTGQPRAWIVPEMSYAMEVAEAEFAGSFPADVAGLVHILPLFWDVTEAAAVYRRAGAVVSMECHSPLIALAEGIPSVNPRQPTDTIKGQMYNDLGLPFVELGPGAEAAAGQLLQKIVDYRPAAAEVTRQARDAAQERVRGMVEAAIAAVGSRIH